MSKNLPIKRKLPCFIADLIQFSQFCVLATYLLQAISQVRSRFTPNVQMIKRCIETLMEKQYIERQEGARDTYTYVA